MANSPAVTHIEFPALPAVRRIGLADLKDALVQGWADFMARPTHMIFLCAIYPVCGLLFARLALGYQQALPLLFPLMAGFALIGPLAALGVYELSRKREQGLETSWGDAFAVLRSPSIGAIVVVGLVLVAIFFAWLRAANAIYEMTLGAAPPPSVEDFFTQVLTTSSGWTMILVGNGVGCLFAIVVLAISVVSFPLLLDRPVGPLVAMVTSVRAVWANPGPIAVWGLIVAASLVIGSLPLFVGLAVVMPVLGHATWHLYRKLVVR